MTKRPQDLNLKLERLSYELGRANMSGNKRQVKSIANDINRTKQTILSLDKLHTSTIVNKERKKYNGK